MAEHTEIKNARFAAAMQALKETKSKEAEEEFVEELVHSAEFYVPMQATGKGKNAKPAFAILSDREQHHYYALFTSKERMKAWKAGKLSYTRLSFRQLSGMAIGDPRISGFVINAKTDNFILGRKLISDAAKFSQSEFMGAVPMEALDQVEFREPSGDYDELLDALLEYMRVDPNIAAAYFREATVRGEDCYIVIVSHIHTMQPSFGNLTTVAKDFGSPKPVAILSARSEIAKKAIHDIMPIYRKPFVIAH